MGNSGSSGGIGSHRRRSRGHGHGHTPAQAPPLPPPAATPQPEINGNHYVFAAATPYPPHYPNQNPATQYYQYTGYYQPPPSTMPMPMPAPYDRHYRRPAGAGAGAGAPPHAEQRLPPYIEHQEAVTIRNDVNLKKDTLRMELDQDHPGHYLVAFTFDATVAGSITIYFFAKEENECNFTPTKEGLQPITVSFDQGLGQIFRQPSGTGIDLSTLDETELLKEGDTEIYPLAVKAEASPLGVNESDNGSPSPKPTNSQITLAVFRKNEKGECHVRVVKQILWVNNSRYELQEIYGIGNTVDTELEGNDPGKECVICLTEPRDTTVLPCRHMCMCSGCAKLLRFQTHRCPICRQPVERLLEIKVNRPDE